MIAFLAPRIGDAMALSDHLAGRQRRVDGPFRLWVGDGPSGDAREVWHIPLGIEGAAAATRLAHRRGARLVVFVGPARPAPAFARGAGLLQGDLLPAGHVADLRGLKPLQRLCADNARVLPQPLGPTPPQWATLAAQDAAAPRAGSLALPATCPLLADELHRQWGIGLLDDTVAGAARIAFELSLPLLASMIVSVPAARGRGGEALSFQQESLGRRAIGRLVEQISGAPLP